MNAAEHRVDLLDRIVRAARSFCGGLERSLALLLSRLATRVIGYRNLRPAHRRGLGGHGGEDMRPDGSVRLVDPDGRIEERGKALAH